MSGLKPTFLGTFGFLFSWIRMTTIAYKDGVMAADSMATIRDIPILGERKLCIKVLNSGQFVLFGQCGDHTASIRIMDALWEQIKKWDKKEKDISKYIESFDPATVALEQNADILVVIPDGTIFSSGTNSMTPINKQFWSIGSGHLPALGAMAAGASAEDAVRIAKEFNVFTGGDIQTITLGAK